MQWPHEMIVESYAMEGEDVIISSLFRNKLNDGLFFDIGCSEPVNNSNSYFFYKRGWRTLAVDGRDLSARWKVDRPKDCFVHGLLGGETGSAEFWTFPDPTMNTADTHTAERYAERFLNSEISRSILPVERAYDMWQEKFEELTHATADSAPPPEIVSIDVEGLEVPVLKGLLEPSKAWRPALLLVETKLFNFMNPLDIEIVRYLVKQHNYTLIAKTPLNAFFIDPFNALFEYLPTTMLFEKN